MAQSYPDVGDNWKGHEYWIRHKPVKPDEAEEGRRFWAGIIDVMKKRKKKATLVTVSGWSEEKVFANTDAEALNKAHESAKAWIDKQDSS